MTAWSARRERLLDRAGEALWCFVVQREAFGLRNTEAVLRELQVPMADQAADGRDAARKAQRSEPGEQRGRVASMPSL